MAGRRSGRRPGPTETRDAILVAARELFAAKGYDGASVRGIARAAEVDPALVHHFFKGKEGLFVAAMEFPADPAEIVPLIFMGPPGEIGERMVRTFLRVWGAPEFRDQMMALLRSAMTNDQATAVFREFVTSALVSRAAATLDIPRVRIEAAVAQMVGIVMLRYALRIEPLASTPEEELVELIAPTIQRYLAP
jgi:AcrR family transcriptional regulator